MAIQMQATMQPSLPVVLEPLAVAARHCSSLKSQQNNQSRRGT
jgi:hypothetical protein